MNKMKATVLDRVAQLKTNKRVRFLLALISGSFVVVQFGMAGLPDLVQNQHITTLTGTIPPPIFPPQCSAEDLKTVSYQLPDYDCNTTSKKPWLNACSFSYATRCPDSIWLTEQYKSTTTRTSTSAPVVIYVGCNKAMDAVNSLRMVSGDAKYDLVKWRDSLFDGQQVEAGRCGQDAGDQFEIIESRANNGNANNNAVVHCIEAMPITASRLNLTSHTLGWHDRLVVSNVAISSTDGSVLFPNAKVGVENMGIENCQGKKGQQNKNCKSVPLYRLDSFVERYLPNDDSLLIDFLSIDVEGFDYEVLLGAPQSLKRIKYIEFEYNWKGTWKKHKLSTAVDALKDAGFVCYWAGTHGHIWRITDCWLEYYNLKFWSNVACVNVRVKEAAPIAARMEDLFQETLDAGRKIHYLNRDTGNTDGGFRTGSDASSSANSFLGRKGRD
jgi:FkbM family methyltransferase